MNEVNKAVTPNTPATACSCAVPQTQPAANPAVPQQPAAPAQAPAAPKAKRNFKKR